MTGILDEKNRIWGKLGVRGRGRMVSWMMWLAFLMGAGGMTVSGLRLTFFYTPYRVEVDCTGAGLDVETVKRWENKESLRDLGILTMAGWSVGSPEEVLSLGTKRRERAQIVKVWGNMELVFPARILSGTYGVVGKEEGCVLSKGLAEALFGSVDVAGERICFQEKGEGRRELIVEGVIDKEGEYLLTFVEKGKVDFFAARFQSRFQAREKLWELLSET
ncbi:MAG: ABC transporter permease [Lachnospiraceae bacterium]|jgi:hypothetical protein|nr:ABC transporter permease [Lachnospiraceae bacterium]